MMSEDDRYRTSTQYRVWSYTPAALFELRTTTNQNAAARVRAALRRRILQEAGQIAGGASEVEVECLTLEEEIIFVTTACHSLLAVGDDLKMPSDVKATAVQYLKRFYLTNSVMTYNPREILLTALYFATKTENHYTNLNRFAQQVTETQGMKTALTPEKVLASEFLLTQGLRFMFDIRHPARALSGAVMELEAMEQFDISPLPGAAPAPEKPERMAERIQVAAGKAKDFLKVPALISDVYFHYTPSQIMLASLFYADPELTEWYIATKFNQSDQDSVAMMYKVHGVVVNCERMMNSVQSIPQLTPEISKKWKKCRNPDKIDLLALQRSKREGEIGHDQKVVKKRKLQGAKENDDFFGAILK